MTAGYQTGQIDNEQFHQHRKFHWTRLVYTFICVRLFIIKVSMEELKLAVYTGVDKSMFEVNHLRRQWD